MNFSLTSLWAVAWTLVPQAAFAQLTLQDYFRDGSVYVRERTVVIEKTVLNEPTVNKVKELLDEVRGDKSLLLKDIPGGVTLQEQRLSWDVQELPVTVKGSCFSACALVALAAKSLTLLPSGRADRPTLLVIHGRFRIEDGNWTAASLKSLDSLSERLRAVPRAEIERALSFRTSSNAGLYIYQNAADAPFGSDSIVYVCERFPAECTDLGIRNLSELNIKHAEPASGIAKP